MTNDSLLIYLELYTYESRTYEFKSVVSQQTISSFYGIVFVDSLR